MWEADQVYYGDDENLKRETAEMWEAFNVFFEQNANNQFKSIVIIIEQNLKKLENFIY